MKHLVAASILTADFSNLQTAVEMVNQSQADWLHLDIMDGVFVPNLTFGIPVVRAIKNHSTKPLDVHLMMVQPERHLANFKDAGADILTVHFEACTHLHRTLNAIRQIGIKAGVVLNPHTPVNMLEDIITEADLVLIMSVNPGFGGQSFIQNSYNKISKLKELVLRKNPDCLIEVDGGVTLQNARQLIDAGVDVLVVGNTIFSTSDPKDVIRDLKNI